MGKRQRPRVEVNLKELDTLVDSAQEKLLNEAECAKIKTALHALAAQLNPEFRSTEKTDKVLEPDEEAPAREPKATAPGHGRNAAAAFKGARQVVVPHESLTPGCHCPECEKGKVYAQKEPKPIVRIVAQMPFQGTVYQMERLRCNLCGMVFVAREPEGVGSEKYDETVAAMVAFLKYGTGMPFNRIEMMQKQAGLPLPASIQWEIAQEAGELVKPVVDALIVEAAQCDVMHRDDTGMQILDLVRAEDDKRTGVHTTGVVATGNDRKIALFATGRQHAGENLDDLLAHRAKGLSAPILMGDALSRNSPKKRLSEGVELLVANCLSHGRRNFVDVAESFPEECRYVLEALGQVYANDARTREQNLDPKQRQLFHRTHSEPVLRELRKWLKAALDEGRVEPNSGLGKAMKYLLTHWDPLTLFVRQPGAPLDNNICERSLKKAVLHRKNALFYRTTNGSEVGDIFMSLIHTCELNEINAYDYLVELQRHAAELRANPADWLPWSYQATLAQARASPTN